MAIRMHSGRMHTTCPLTVVPVFMLGGGGLGVVLSGGVVVLSGGVVVLSGGVLVLSMVGGPV